MAIINDALKGLFYQGGARKMTPSSLVCLLSANGAATFNGTVERVSSIVYAKDDFVDLGLPSGTLWCKRNLGATVETASGLYFSWGNLDGHANGSGYNFNDTTYNATDAAAIAADLTISQDAARANKGLAWKMPTKEQFSELCNPTFTDFVDANGNVISSTDKRTTINGVVGLRIKSKTNGKIVFFPAVGYYDGTTLTNRGTNGYYWSSSFNTATRCYYLNFKPDGVLPENDYYRRFGFPIRPVL